MKIAIVHYHLRRGGVTNVILSAIEALQEIPDCEVLVISGEKPDVGVSIENLALIPGLTYRKSAYLSTAEGLKEALKEAAQSHFGSLPDLWHFHNHSLGKNVLIPSVVSGLASEKARLLLQIHDFAEDGRPKNYVAQRSVYDHESEFADTLYPRASQVHYATINRRDRNFLEAAGLKRERIHLLSNPVNGIPSQTSPEERPFCREKKLVLYPTRAIRRKNLGELLLLSLAHGEDCEFATSLAPENPEWMPIYDRWRNLALELNLPIRFGVAQKADYSFPDLIGWSDSIITTSVAEGFGLAFLEPWLSGKSVVGRDLPRITGDFSHWGIDLDHLYQRIDAPLSSTQESALRDEADATLRRIYLAYNFPLPKNAVEQTFSRWMEDGTVDFGMLNEDFQIEIIQKAAADSGFLRSLNLQSLDDASPAVVEKNRLLVREHFSLDSYGEKLHAVYRKTLRATPGRVKSLKPEKVLEQFLDPWRLNLLRT